jgi:HNH endonuclease
MVGDENLPEIPILQRKIDKLARTSRFEMNGEFSAYPAPVNRKPPGTEKRNPAEGNKAGLQGGVLCIERGDEYSITPTLRRGQTRFFSKVKVTDSGCWQWLDCHDGDGLGRFKYRGRSEYAHRMAWRLVNGPVPQGKFLHCTCGNVGCCNPSHREPMTPEQHGHAVGGAT